MTRRMTQKEIAKRAGVSQATVSLVLNGSADDRRRIPEATRDRIRKVIADTGYVADPVARRMAKGQNNILGVFTYEPAFPSEQADFFAPFLFGIEEAAQEREYDLLLMTSAGRTPDGRKRIFGESNRLRLADGCIVLGREIDAGELGRLVKDGFPFIAVGRRDDAGGPVPYVGADYRTATLQLVERARAYGHRKFAYIGPKGGVESVADRWAGFRDGVVNGCEVVLQSDDTDKRPGDLMSAIRASGATIAFFAELADAIPFKRAIVADGLSVPGDLSIVVLGRHIRPGETYTSFTTYAVPREEMARKATLALIRRLEGKADLEQTLLPCEPVEGETLGPINSKSDV